jgi:hypothetical protein
VVWLLSLSLLYCLDFLSSLSNFSLLVFIKTNCHLKYFIALHCRLKLPLPSYCFHGWNLGSRGMKSCISSNLFNESSITMLIVESSSMSSAKSSLLLVSSPYTSFSLKNGDVIFLFKAAPWNQFEMNIGFHISPIWFISSSFCEYVSKNYKAMHKEEVWEHLA